MNRWCISVFILAAATTAWADAPAPERPAAAQGPSVERLFNALDVNGDGVIDRHEARERLPQLLSRIREAIGTRPRAEAAAAPDLERKINEMVDRKLRAAFQQRFGERDGRPGPERRMRDGQARPERGMRDGRREAQRPFEGRDGIAPMRDMPRRGMGDATPPAFMPPRWTPPWGDRPGRDIFGPPARAERPRGPMAQMGRDMPGRDMFGLRERAERPRRQMTEPRRGMRDRDGFERGPQMRDGFGREPQKRDGFGGPRNERGAFGREPMAMKEPLAGPPARREGAMDQPKLPDGIGEAAAHPRLMKLLDLNGDGKVERQELEMAAKALTALKERQAKPRADKPAERPPGPRDIAPPDRPTGPPPAKEAMRPGAAPERERRRLLAPPEDDNASPAAPERPRIRERDERERGEREPVMREREEGRRPARERGDREREDRDREDDDQ